MELLYGDLFKKKKKECRDHILSTQKQPKISVSSVGSTCSVGFKGQAVNLEQALDSTIRDLQSHLNLVQCHLRSIAATVEQDDDLRQMGWLFEDLRSFATDLISVPETAEDKSQMKVWKVQRKEIERKLQIEHIAAVKTERAASKLALKAEKLLIREDSEMKQD